MTTVTATVRRASLAASPSSRSPRPWRSPPARTVPTTVTSRQPLAVLGSRRGWLRVQTDAGAGAVGPRARDLLRARRT